MAKEFHTTPSDGRTRHERRPVSSYSESNFRNIGNEIYAKLESMNEQRLGTTDDFELLLQNLCHTSVCLVIPVAA